MPGPDFGGRWNVGVNCYAYAVHHRPDVGNTLLEPGALSGGAWTRGRDPAHFWALVVRDGATSVSAVYDANPAGMPAPGANPGHYLIAMKLNSTGLQNYHAIRRDETSGEWWQTALGWSGVANYTVIGQASHIQQPHADGWANPRIAALQPFDVWIGYFWVPIAGLQAAPARRRLGCCYITTATCRTLGLPDDCDELTTLRWFRDNVLLGTFEGRKEVGEYYTRAPQLVAAIESRPDAAEIYAAMLERGVRPAVEAVKRNDHAAAHAIFRREVERLEREHGRRRR